MSETTARFEPGTRVKNARGTRGTVNGYHRDNLSVSIDGGGSDSGPAHFRAWRPLSAEELAAEQATVRADAAVQELRGAEVHERNFQRVNGCACGRSFSTPNGLGLHVAAEYRKRDAVWSAAWDSAYRTVVAELRAAQR